MARPKSVTLSLHQQSQAIVDGVKSAGVSADTVGYVECHSTGTIVGDPLEVEALTVAFRKETERKQYCAIGSVKANIGHPEQAAGIAGLIKTALALHREQSRRASIIKHQSAYRLCIVAFLRKYNAADFPLADAPQHWAK